MKHPLAACNDNSTFFSFLIHFEKISFATFCVVSLAKRCLRFRLHTLPKFLKQREKRFVTALLFFKQYNLLPRDKWQWRKGWAICFSSQSLYPPPPPALLGITYPSWWYSWQHSTKFCLPHTFTSWCACVCAGSCTQVYLRKGVGGICVTWGPYSPCERWYH